MAAVINKEGVRMDMNPDYTKRVSEEKIIAVKKVNGRIITVGYVEKEKYINVVTVY